MKGLLLLTALVLSACAPGVLGSATTDPGSAKLTLTQADGYKLVTFSSGTQPAESPGFTLAVNDPSCTANANRQLICRMATLPEHRTYGLPARGVLVVEVSSGRPDGKRYMLEMD
ncbi:hypothetical protein ACFFLM_23550 [Deinococcus oregonensis]|uniref:Lipoprotein n=1 Tax=Deinococcus oregonensis TaxID=1805970 RepID=A0ABV6B5G1_9DEIO